MKSIEIDWSNAPEGYPVWIESLVNSIASGWHRDDGNRYTDMRGGFWSKPEEGYYQVHFGPKKDAPRNGTDLPPVGTVCEGRGRLDGEWREVVVLAHRIGRAVVSFTDHERLQWCEADELRPIRAAAEIGRRM